MKKMNFLYQTRFDFDQAVFDHHVIMRCCPRNDDRQRLISLETSYVPKMMVESSQDFWGNTVYSGYIKEAHRSFEYMVKGSIMVDHSKRRTGMHPIFKYNTEVTCMNEEMLVFLKEVYMEKATPLEQALILQNALYERQHYLSGSTNVTTTAAQAFSKKHGVCQDYAHILIALCRSAGIAARYVAGMMIGEGQTHAWVEVYSEGAWYGLDPTNNYMIDETYIKLSHGRDYRDCTVIRGVFRGNTAQTQEIYVSVEEDYD